MKILIIGLGSIAQKHIRALRKLRPDAELYALRSLKTAQKQEGINDVYDINELEIGIIDFAIISNPTSIHLKTIKSLIPFNTPLFIEKPLFSEIGKDADQIIEEINNKGIITYVACNLRFLGCLQFIKEYLKNKRINEVNIYCGSYLPDWRVGRDYKTTYSANKELGGGVHIDLIHEIDYVYWMFGKPQRVSKVFSNHSSLEISAYDYANYILGYDNFNTSVILNYFRRDPKRTLEIVFEDETILVDIYKNKVYKNSDIIFDSEKTIMDTYEYQLQFFMDHVLATKKQFNTVNEAYEILKICLEED
ncbi:Gfo/Idh/MocA family protein [uncultured Aquimarina sp.]|uniref:Gfo/Idh/MocA family protein n=1 Tax=uncultured Aquimarina sp. TaxID=575652 RepID=UPI0026057D39|nr:Gfo/Idh/MocA family oxidoreductase [uncultured Aquimarina sp.]